MFPADFTVGLVVSLARFLCPGHPVEIDISAIVLGCETWGVGNAIRLDLPPVYPNPRTLPFVIIDGMI